MRADGGLPESHETLESLPESGRLKLLGQHRPPPVGKTAANHRSWQELSKALHGSLPLRFLTTVQLRVEYIQLVATVDQIVSGLERLDGLQTERFTKQRAA